MIFDGVRTQIKRLLCGVGEGGNRAFFCARKGIFYGWIFKWVFKVDIHLGGNWIFKTGFWDSAIGRG